MNIDPAFESTAIAHYRRWTNRRFVSWRIYAWVLAVGGVAAGGFWGWVARETGKPFEWVNVAKVFTLYIVMTFVMVFVMRYAAVSGGWIVAKRARSLAEAGRGDEAWSLLVARYQGIHPLVASDPAFHRVLVEVASASHSSPAKTLALAIDKSGPSARSSDPASKAAAGTAFAIAVSVLVALYFLVRILFLHA